MVADKTRREKFYLLSMIKKKSEANIGLSELEAKFQAIIDGKMIQIEKTNHKAISLELRDGSYVVELIKQENHICFLKLGINNPGNSVALRDRTTLESDSLSIGPTQNLEIYTFCVIDFETGILSYIGMNGSPRVSVLKELLDQCYSGDGLAAILAVIYSPDILNALSKKKRVTRLKLDIAIPVDKQLEKIGVTEPVFDKMRGKVTKTMSYIVRADRGKSIFDDPGAINKAVHRALDGVDTESIISFSASGKDDGEEYAQTFNLLDTGITVYEKINRDVYDKSDDETRLNIIYTAYERRKPEILSFIQS